MVKLYVGTQIYNTNKIKFALLLYSLSNYQTINYMKPLILTALAFLTFALHSQTQKYVGITLGASYPLQAFGAKNINDSLSGYGTGAIGYTINYDAIRDNNFGYYFSYTNHSIGFDIDQFCTDLKPSGYTLQSGSSKRYNIKGLNFGASYTILSKHKLNIAPKLGIGLSICRNRTATATYTNGVSTIGVKTEAPTVSALNLNYGFDLNYKSTPDSKFSYSLKLIWQLQSPNFTNTITTSLNGGQFDKSQQTYNQPQAFYSFGIGARYNL